MSDEKYLITSEEIAEIEGLQKTHFLNSSARRINKSLGDLVGLTGLGVHLIEVQPGDLTTEHHMHFHEDECVYVLSGAATAFIGDDEFEVKEGDFLGYRKGGKPHSIYNSGDGLLCCLVIGQRLPHDVGDYTNLKKRIYRNVGMPWNLVDFAEIDKPAAGEKTLADLRGSSNVIR